jgi:3-carboxy-cis,cis-muconate cycloisomerase
VSDLFWPGADRAGDLLSGSALLTAMVAVEQAWLDVLGEAPGVDLTSLVGPDDLSHLAVGAEAGGNPVIELVAMLRARCGSQWVHRGLTSQDVLDTALMLCMRDVVTRLSGELKAQVDVLVEHAAAHRKTVMAGRTLTQHAVPITFGLKAAGWLNGVLDARDAVDALRLPVQIGGAAGTLSAVTELAGGPEAAVALAHDAADRLGLKWAPPWHTNRRPVTAIGDALVTCTDTWGRVATDVATLSRPEIGELAEGTGGASSTMPHKHNPVLSVLVRRAALTTPPLTATLHIAAALAADERPDGAWHTEWAPLRDLGRRAVVAGAQTTALLAGLRVDTERMAATARGAWAQLTAEHEAIHQFVPESAHGHPLGAADLIVDEVLGRARQEQP